MRKKCIFFILDIVIVLLMFFIFHNTSFAEVKKCNFVKKWDYVYDEKLKCFMSTEEVAFYIKSINNTMIKYYTKNKIRYCKVVKGEWLIGDYNNNKLFIEKNRENIKIVFVIPFSFFEKQVDCDNMNLVYNYINNLELVDISNNYSMMKNNKFYKKRQKTICKLINKDLKLSLKCSEL